MYSWCFTPALRAAIKTQYPGVFLIAPGQYASPSQGYPQQYIARTHFIHLAPLVQSMDSAIHQINLYPVDLTQIMMILWINQYPVDKYQGNQLLHLCFETGERERDLCGGLGVIYPSNNWGLGEERQSGATFLSKETMQWQDLNPDLKFKVLTAQFMQALCLHD